MEQPISDDIQEKQRQLIERARKGVLKHIKEKGGKLSLSEMHDFSLNRYLIQHQAFSRLMETLVDEGLIDFDQGSYTATLTELGEKFILQ